MSVLKLCLFLFIISIHTELFVALEYKGEGCTRLRLINVDRTCPEVGLYSIPGFCDLYENCTSVGSSPHTQSCYPGFNFNGTDCIAADSTLMCAQLDCVLIKDSADSHELDLNSLETTESTNREKIHIIGSIKLLVSNLSLRQITDDIIKKEIAMKGQRKPVKPTESENNLSSKGTSATANNLSIVNINFTSNGHIYTSINNGNITVNSSSTDSSTTGKNNHTFIIRNSTTNSTFSHQLFPNSHIEVGESTTHNISMADANGSLLQLTSGAHTVFHYSDATLNKRALSICMLLGFYFLKTLQI